MSNELEIEDEGTVATAYLKSTEDRIVNELKQAANYSMHEVTEEMVMQFMENERINVIELNTPKAIADQLMSLLNIIEQRLLHNISNSSKQ